MKENDKISVSSEPTEPKSQNILEKKEIPNIPNSDILFDLKVIRLQYDNFITIINNLNIFDYKLQSIQDISIILKNEFLIILQKLAELDNIKINLTLYRIYLDIISKESLYSSYLVFDNNYINTLEKVSFLLYLIDECVLLIKRLNGFVFDQELFAFKNKTIQLIQYLYSNCKNKIQDEDKLNKLQEFLNSLPAEFYSPTYLELINNKALLEIYKTQSLDKIANFESKFLDINNYYEQYEVFKRFVLSNSGTLMKINEKNLENNNNINAINTNINTEFTYNYGLLLLRFCKYHRYIFLNKEESQEEKILNEPDEENENARVVFLLDKFKIGNKNNYSQLDQKNKRNVASVLEDKQFLSVLESNEYSKLIKMELNYYLEQTKNMENQPKIKNLREQMAYYLGTLNNISFAPLYLKEFNKIFISDNFSPAFLTNVPAGKANKFYLETSYNGQILVCIEFTLEDKTKDITFEINRYNIYNNSFEKIYHEESIEGTFKFFILCNGYSLYEIIFNNDYSWFNSKDINYKISLLKYMEKPVITKDSIFNYNLEGKKFSFDTEEIIEKIGNKEHEKNININVIFYKNILRIAKIEKNENEKEEITFKEINEQNEAYITRHLFEYSLIEHFKKMKINPLENQKIIISIYSQNRDLTKLSKNIEDKIKIEKNPKSLEFLNKIGFIPSNQLDDFKVEYKLYDLSEQFLIYHLFLCKYQKMEIAKTILSMNFDKLVVNYALYNEGTITTSLKEKIDFQNSSNNDEFVLNFIKNVNTLYGGISLILSYIDYNEEEKKKNILEMFEKIKKFCI